MKRISVLFGLVIFLCVVTVSFSHTVALYERVGFVQWEAVLITCAVETTFLLSGWSILWYRNKGQRPGGPAYAGFLYGVVLVLFSNAAYTVGLGELFENQVAQWVLALSVVFGVLISEAIISRNLVKLNEEHAAEAEQETAVQVDTEQAAPEQAKVGQIVRAEQAEQPKQVEQVQPVQPNKRKPNKRRVQRSKQNSEQVDKQIYEVVRKKALEVYEQTGRIPGRPTLKELTGYSDRQLLPVVRKLKEELAS